MNNTRKQAYLLNGMPQFCKQQDTFYFNGRYKKEDLSNIDEMIYHKTDVL